MVDQKKVVVIGGGFAGLQLAKGLSGSGYLVTLVDKQNHHMFQPLFYQVATAGLDPSSISFPFRKIFQHFRNIQFRMASVEHILPEERIIQTSQGNIPFDLLVIATGCNTNFFGNREIAEKAYTMKTTSEALEIKYGILSGLERLTVAEGTEKEELMTLVITGAGPTGVELAGAFAEMKKNILPKDYPGIDFTGFRIILLEGSGNTLNAMSDESKKASESYLREMGVEVIKNVFLTGYDGKTATLNTGQQFKTAHLVWAAGVIGNTLVGVDKAVVEKGRYIVDRFNRLEGYDHIYAIGDVALMKTPAFPKGHPQLANVAIGQAKKLVQNLRNGNNGKPWREYEYKDLGSLATVGKHKAVVDLPFIKFQGYLAWFFWMSLHLMLILSVKNKIIIFINWVWCYFTNDSSLRIILKNPGGKK